MLYLYIAHSHSREQSIQRRTNIIIFIFITSHPPLLIYPSTNEIMYVPANKNVLMKTFLSSLCVHLIVFFPSQDWDSRSGLNHCLYQLGTSTCVFVCVSVSRRGKLQGAVMASSSLGILLLGSVEWSLGSGPTMTRLSQQDETRYCEAETRALLLCMRSSSFRQKLKQKHQLLNISFSSIRGNCF